MLEFIFGDHYKDLGRRRVFSRKKYFYEFLGLLFIILLTVTSLSYAEEEESKDNTEAKILCRLKAYDSDFYSVIEEILEAKNIVLICPEPSVGA